MDKSADNGTWDFTWTFQLLIETYCLFDEQNYFVPEYGFKMPDLVIYLNHDIAPNILSINDGEEFEALADINSGQELLINYGHLVDEMEHEVAKANRRRMSISGWLKRVWYISTK